MRGSYVRTVLRCFRKITPLKLTWTFKNPVFFEVCVFSAWCFLPFPVVFFGISWPPSAHGLTGASRQHVPGEFSDEPFLGFRSLDLVGPPRHCGWWNMWNEWQSSYQVVSSPKSTRVSKLRMFFSKGEIPMWPMSVKSPVSLPKKTGCWLDPILFRQYPHIWHLSSFFTFGKSAPVPHSARLPVATSHPCGPVETSWCFVRVSEASFFGAIALLTPWISPGNMRGWPTWVCSMRNLALLGYRPIFWHEEYRV